MVKIFLGKGNVMSWINITGWQLSSNTPVKDGHLLIGKHIEDGDYYLAWSGRNELTLSFKNDLAFIINAINYHKSTIRLSEIWVWKPDLNLAQDDQLPRFRISTSMPTSTLPSLTKKNQYKEIYEQLSSYGVF